MSSTVSLTSTSGLMSQGLRVTASSLSPGRPQRPTTLVRLISIWNSVAVIACLPWSTAGVRRFRGRSWECRPGAGHRSSSREHRVPGGRLRRRRYLRRGRCRTPVCEQDRGGVADGVLHRDHATDARSDDRRRKPGETVLVVGRASSQACITTTDGFHESEQSARARRLSSSHGVPPPSSLRRMAPRPSRNRPWPR